MPVPQTWADLSTNPASNSPAGTEPLGNQADDYIRSAFAFLKQLHDGWLAADGSVKLTGNLDANGKRILNLPLPAAATDPATKAYADSLISTYFPRGAVVMWWGTTATIPAGWILCDGNNGTPNFINNFPMGTNAVAYGGNSYPTITYAQMPVHSHGLHDPGHAHGVYDPSHGHGISDGGHAHSLPNAGSVQAGADNGGAQSPVATGYSSGRGQQGTNAANANIGIYGNTTGIGIYASGTGMYMDNAGGGAAFDNRPAFCAILFIMKT